MEPASTKITTPTTASIYKSVTAPIPAHITEHPPLTKARKKAKNKQGSTSPETSEALMETATNLKRRRSSGEGAAKKVCSGPPCLEEPLEGPSNVFSPKPKPLPQQAPLNLQFPPPLLSLPPPILPLLPPPPLPLPPPPLPQNRTPQHAPPEQKCSQPPQVLQPSQSPQPPKLSHYPPHSPKTRPHQISHIARSQSHERLSQRSLLSGIVPSSNTRRERTSNRTSKRSSDWRSRTEEIPGQTKAANEELTEEQCRKAVALCTVGLESVTDYQLRKTLKPLIDLEKINGKRVCNPTNFRSAPMVTTFARSSGDHSKGVWKFLDTVHQTDTGVVLAELEHSSLKRCLPYCWRRIPILVHPSLYRSLKVRFPLDVGGVSRKCRMTTELGTGSLRRSFGIITPGDFRPIVDTD